MGTPTANPLPPPAPLVMVQLIAAPPNAQAWIASPDDTRRAVDVLAFAAFRDAQGVTRVVPMFSAPNGELAPVWQAHPNCRVVAIVRGAS